MARALQAVAVALCAVLAVQVAQLGALGPLMLAAVLVVAGVGAIRWRQWRQIRPPSDPAWMVVPLASSWLVVTLLPIHKFSHRPITGTGGPSLRPESVIELLAFGGAGLVALVVLRALEPTLDRARPPLVLFLFPLWTIASSVWSATGPYAFARGAQMIATALLAWATVALGSIDRVSLREVIEAYLRWFVRVTLVLVVLGVLFGPVFVSASDANLDRFTWVGAHPLAAGVILSSALVIAVATPDRVLRVYPWIRAAMAAVFVAALFPNHTRQMWIALVLVLMMALTIKGRVRPAVRWVGAPLILAGAVAAVVFQGSEIWEYLLRDDDSDSLSTGNGRIQLWGIGLRALDSPLDWLIGLGHGITRTVFVAEAPWANSAHNSLLAVIVSAGLIGVCFFVALLVATARYVMGARLWAASPTGFTLTLLLLLMLMNGVASDNLAIPDIGTGVLFLVVAVAIVHYPAEREVRGMARSAPPRDATERQPEVASSAAMSVLGATWR